YIGCVGSVEDLVIFRDPNKRQIVRRKADIQKLDETITGFTMWGDMAWEFDKGLIETLEGPVIIVISSCHVSQYRGECVTLVRHLRFSCEATITNVDRSRDWYYRPCVECKRKVKDDRVVWKCVDHGPQAEPTYKCDFKAFVSDETGTTVFTFFTPVANAITGYDIFNIDAKHTGSSECPNPQHIPAEIVALKGKKHTFLFHFNISSKIGAVDFTLDEC
ncbi:nucleic acid-binding, OB-fold protein, partial [Tanacetum coccineum]